MEDEDGNGSVADDDRVEDDEGNSATVTVAVVELSVDSELRWRER